METITGSDTMNLENIIDKYIVPLVLIECVLMFNLIIIIGILNALGVI
jgi:hypothetical protein